MKTNLEIERMYVNGTAVGMPIRFRKQGRGRLSIADRVLSELAVWGFYRPRPWEYETPAVGEEVL